MKEFMESLTEQAASFLSPVSELNKLVLNNLGELVDIQSQAVSNYAELGIGQAKAALEIRDSDSLSAFTQQQSEVAETVQAQFKGDTEKMSSLASSTVNDIKRIFSKDAE